jgi:hypothetical protein
VHPEPRPPQGFRNHLTLSHRPLCCHSPPLRIPSPPCAQHPQPTLPLALQRGSKLTRDLRSWKERRRLPSGNAAVTLSSSRPELSRSLPHLTLPFLWSRSDGSRCHHRPHRSTWEGWRQARARLCRCSPLRRCRQPSSTHRHRSPSPDHR